MARTDVRVMGQADCSFVFGLFLQELSLLALMESADPRLIFLRGLVALMQIQAWRIAV